MTNLGALAPSVMIRKFLHLPFVVSPSMDSGQACRTMNGTSGKHVPFDKPVLSQSKGSGRTVNVKELALLLGEWVNAARETACSEG